MILAWASPFNIRLNIGRILCHLLLQLQDHSTCSQLPNYSSPWHVYIQAKLGNRLLLKKTQNKQMTQSGMWLSETKNVTYSPEEYTRPQKTAPPPSRRAEKTAPGSLRNEGNTNTDKMRTICPADDYCLLIGRVKYHHKSLRALDTSLGTMSSLVMDYQPRFEYLPGHRGKCGFLCLSGCRPL